MQRWIPGAAASDGLGLGTMVHGHFRRGAVAASLGAVAMLALLGGWSPGFSAPRIKVVLREDTVYPGVIVHGEVLLGSPTTPFQNLVGVGFRLNYDSASMAMTRLAVGDIFRDVGKVTFARIVQSAGQGAFSISSTGGVATNGSAVVSVFDLLVSGNAPGGQYVVSVNDIQAISFGGQPLLFQAESDTFLVVAGVGSVGAGGNATTLQVTRPFPNPLRDRTQVTLDLRESRRVRAAVYDSGGRLIRQLLDEDLERGPHSVIWDARRSDGSMAAAGIYFLSIADRTTVHSSSVVVLR